MSIPLLKKSANRTNINIKIDKEIDDIYRMAKQNGYNSSEIARKAVSDAFRRLADQLRRPAS